MSAMTASGSKSLASRQPHDVPLSQSPEKAALLRSKKRKTGKEKQTEGGGSPARRVEGSDGEWDHIKAGTAAWKWVSLTDSSASKHPPIFTKDSRYVALVARYCSQRN